MERPVIDSYGKLHWRIRLALVYAQQKFQWGFTLGFVAGIAFAMLAR